MKTSIESIKSLNLRLTSTKRNFVLINYWKIIIIIIARICANNRQEKAYLKNDN